eukprot:01951.XXX_8277_9475_1 [CDS] Oithona nana genome sequencing.
MEETTISKIIAASLVFLMTAIFGYLPSFVSRKAPLKSPGDPDYDKKSRRNVVFAFLLNFGGGVLFANCFCHWLPEVREAIEGFDIDSNLPLPEVIVSLGFFMISFLEELIHHFVHPHQKKTDEVSIELQNHPEISKEETSEDHPEDHSEESVDRSQAKRTKSLLRTAFVVASLSFHSVMAGLTLGLENESGGVWINFGAIAMHKFVIAFSVGVELITSRATKGQYFLSIIIFSLAPPIGTVIGIVLTLNSSDSGSEVVNISEELPLQILQALATGTVIYVIFFEIFPKAKEIGGTGFQHVISSIIGFAVFLPTLA